MVSLSYVPPSSGTKELLAVFMGIEEYEGHAQSTATLAIHFGP
ncbi:MAG TPA: hypothetical protein VMS77_03645 [Conexivisphaerales archaeon]|nr:hypothetical protein [Conexivisphaerales archaeon]